MVVLNFLPLLTTLVCYPITWGQGRADIPIQGSQTTSVDPPSLSSCQRLFPSPQDGALPLSPSVLEGMIFTWHVSHAIK